MSFLEGNCLVSSGVYSEFNFRYVRRKKIWTRDPCFYIKGKKNDITLGFVFCRIFGESLLPIR